MSRTFRLRHEDHKSFQWWAWKNKDKKATHYPDGFMHDEGHKHYKEYSDTERRLNEKIFLDQIEKKDYDEIPLPTEKEMKYLGWVVW